MNLILKPESDSLIGQIEFEKEYYGILPQCQPCHCPCKQYNAPRLGLFICKKSPEYEIYAGRF
jgi:hypothetical protein